MDFYFERMVRNDLGARIPCLGMIGSPTLWRPRVQQINGARLGLKRAPCCPCNQIPDQRLSGSHPVASIQFLTAFQVLVLPNKVILSFLEPLVYPDRPRLPWPWCAWSSGVRRERRSQGCGPLIQHCNFSTNRTWNARFIRIQTWRIARIQKKGWLCQCDRSTPLGSASLGSW